MWSTVDRKILISDASICSGIDVQLPWPIVKEASMACQLAVLQCWVFSEADLWVTADPCTLSDDDPMSTLEFIVPLFIMWTLSESLESHLYNTVLFVSGQYGFGGRGRGWWEGMYLWWLFVFLFFSLFMERLYFYLLMNRKDVWCFIFTRMICDF